MSLLEEDPFRRFKVPGGAKKVVTFLSDGVGADAQLPVEMQQAAG